MLRSAFPIVFAIVALLLGRAVMTADSLLDAKTTPAAATTSQPTMGNQQAWGRAQGLPGF